MKAIAKNFAGLATAIFALLVVCVSRPVLAQDQPDAAAPPDATTRPAAVPMPRLRAALQALGRGNQNQNLAGPVDPAEWNALLAFLDDNSPHRAAVLRKQPPRENSPLKTNLVRFWRSYKVLAERVPDIAALRKDNLKQEDDIFFLMAGANKDPQRSRVQLREQIHQKVAAILDNNAKERQIRIDMLKQQLDAEEADLQKFQANESANVETRTNSLMKSVAPRRQGKQNQNPENRDAPPAATEPSSPQTDAGNSSEQLAQLLLDNPPDNSILIDLVSHAPPEFSDAFDGVNVD